MRGAGGGDGHARGGGRVQGVAHGAVPGYPSTRLSRIACARLASRPVRLKKQGDAERAEAPAGAGYAEGRRNGTTLVAG